MMPSGQPAEDVLHRYPSGYSALRLLVVEDDYVTADALCRELEALGTLPVPPASTIEQAMQRLTERRVDVAILDINLRGTRVFPLADLLMDMRMPFVFYTGYDDIVVPVRFKNMPLLLKPATGTELLRAIGTNPDFARPPLSEGFDPGRGEVVDAIPRLRAMAFMITKERSSADRLVEAALKRAIDTVDDQPPHATLEDWLTGLVADCAFQQGYRTIH